LLITLRSSLPWFPIVDVLWTCNAGRAGAQPYPPYARKRPHADTPIRRYVSPGYQRRIASQITRNTIGIRVGALTPRN
jgi:hypothetical protein